MIVLVLERVPVGLRGELTRWLLEVRAGVFVGRVSAMVRDKLWEKVQQKGGGGAGMLVHLSQNEQGYNIRTFGDTSREVVDYDGLLLIRRPHPGEKEKRRAKKEELDQNM
jgi:CRISPR-associated protein Cas2